MPDPYDVYGTNGHCAIEGTGPSTPWTWNAYVAVGSTVAAINAAIAAAAKTVAEGHGYTIDVVRIVDGCADVTSVLIPGASGTQSLASGTPRQPSTTRPVLVMVSGSWSWNLSAIGTQTGSLTLKSDSGSTPTTVIRSTSWSRGISVGITVGDTGTVPVEMDLVVPPTHYYSVTAAGGATFSIREQVM